MCINNSSKLILLVPAIVSILKHYLELTVLLSKEDKEISLSYYKRLTTYIRGNNVLKQKLGICLGFVFVDYAKLQIIYPGTDKIKLEINVRFRALKINIKSSSWLRYL